MGGVELEGGGEGGGTVQEAELLVAGKEVTSQVELCKGYQALQPTYATDGIPLHEGVNMIHPHQLRR